jgi:acyl-coenzyme A synthetase/AMP-(fatty) acid ligase
MGSVQADVSPGKRLLLPLLERIAQIDPERIYASIPKTNYLKDGYREVTYRELACAVNRAAGWLEDTYGRSSTFETLAYMGPSDIRYFIFVLAASYVGYKVRLQWLLFLPFNLHQIVV